MKPRIITLPDSLRDALEPVLAAITLDGGDKSDEDCSKNSAKLARAIASVLYPEDNPPKHPSFLGQIVDRFLHPNQNKSPASYRELQEALLELYRGTGTPVIQLENLPAHGNFFIRGLARLLSGAITADASPLIAEPADQTLSSRAAKVEGGPSQEFHTDIGDPRKKIIHLLYCDEPGKKFAPTIFVTADEVIHAMVKSRLKAGFTGEEYAAQKAALVERLSVERTGMGETIGRPFLYRNPHYRPDSGAPEFFTSDDTSSGVYYSDSGLFGTYKATEDGLRQQAMKDSTASTRKNTAAIWNEYLVKHARSVGADGSDRLLYSYIASGEHPVAQDYYPDPPDPAHYPPAARARDEQARLNDHDTTNPRAASATAAPFTRIDRTALERAALAKPAGKISAL